MQVGATEKVIARNGGGCRNGHASKVACPSSRVHQPGAPPEEDIQIWESPQKDNVPQRVVSTRIMHRRGMSHKRSSPQGT